MKRLGLHSLVVITSVALPASAASAEAISAADIAERVCSDRPAGRPLNISLSRLAEETLRSNQLYLDDLSPPNGSVLQKLRALQMIRIDNEETIFRDRVIGALSSIRDLEAELGKKSFDALTVANVDTSQPGWLFSEASEAATFTCKPAKTKTILAGIAAPPARARFALREKPEDLGLTGKDRKAASAFAFGVEKKWSTDEDGVETESTTLKFDGTAGLRLTSDDSPLVTYAFAQYNLDRTRSEPAAPLEPGKRRNENDTNVLALGASFDYFHYREGQSSFWVTAQSAYLNDFVDDSERIRISAKLDPGFNGDLGLCRAGSIGYFGTSTKIGARCLARLDSEIGFWLNDGISTAKSYDDFVAIGANFSYELYFDADDKTGVLASVNYRYLPVLSGTLDDIERFEFTLGQRFWTGSNLGIEVKASYNNGTNALSLMEEEELSVGIGLIY